MTNADTLGNDAPSSRGVVTEPPQVIRLSDDTKVGSVVQVGVMREWARQWVALIIVSSLFILVIMSFLLLFVLMCIRDNVGFPELRGLTEILIAPVIGVVGAVTGFYFGESRSSNNQGE